MPSRTNFLAESMYEIQLAHTREQSDIVADLPFLRVFAERCGHITEMGVRHGCSTTALLASQPLKLISYDINPCPFVDTLKEASGNTEYHFLQKDVLTIEIEPTDLLFIDTLHTYDQLTAELKKHQGRVRRYIAMHDVVSFGDKGEDGKEPGLNLAISEFLHERPYWKMSLLSLTQNGLAVLERIEGGSQV